MVVTLTVPCPAFGLFDRDPNTVLETQVRRPTLTKLERMASYNCATMRRLSTSRLTCRYVRGVVAANETNLLEDDAGADTRIGTDGRRGGGQLLTVWLASIRIEFCGLEVKAIKAWYAVNHRGS